MAVLSAKRRREFTSAEEALEIWSSKPFFRSWDRDALLGLVRGGLKQRSRNKWVLCCSPETETGYFSSYFPLNRWDSLRSATRFQCPTHIIVGRHTSIPLYSKGRAERHFSQDVFANTFGNIVSLEVTEKPLGDHLGPMEAPSEFAAKIYSVLVDVLSLRGKSPNPYKL